MSRGDASRRRVRVLAVVVALAAIAIPAPASATTPSTVRDWNLYAVQTLANAPNAVAPTPKGAGQTPPVANLHLAMAQGAVYDAVNSIDKSHRPYLAGLPAASSSASVDAAVSTAAHDVLVGLLRQFPITTTFTTTVRDEIRARLDSLYAASLAGIGAGPNKDAGIAAGSAAAKAMLAARSHEDVPTDGRFGPFRFPLAADPGPGRWRPTPPAFVNDPNAWVARVSPFMLRSPSQFPSDGMPALTSVEYAADFNEVKRMGAASGSGRSNDQTAIALFHSGNPFPIYNTTFRGLAEARNLTPVQEARLFAMSSMTAADALISCWDDKARWLFWRPITGIQLADTDGNPGTAPDTGWSPLIANPPYPDQPSGYNCFTSAMFHTAQDYFGTDKMAFSITSSASGTAVTRNYTRLSAVWKETIDARVWLGIHWRTADVAGVVIGLKVSHWREKHFFQPVN
jgi:hypothetical protein